ncbi:retropepsin-like aspartic protease family protein [Propylenella binzhouense]|uniref:TIGR02281 family clan AA aspartic protease n=1 Tax=Propylenella binzhouense TaxID=2555902 RepID=A0A964WSU5_9HYPH|nr:TIGR02281 family clan AA aspartic protease [Propylenella binzhouense]MYZ47165.1 TIGR02281 family clan AA aspartic protease [Propylenella binzhouense]
MFGLDDERLARFVYLLLWLVLLLSGAIVYRGQRRLVFRHLFTWAAILLGLVVLYSFRTPLLDLAAPVLRELDPSRAVEVESASGARELVVTRGADGHFHVRASADGTALTFMVDTGASNTTLTFRDADRIGLHLEGLRFERPVRTAAGLAFAAPARIGALAIGPFRLRNLAIGVMPEGSLDTSLLGLDVLDRFRSWRVEGDRLVLVP